MDIVPNQHSTKTSSDEVKNHSKENDYSIKNLTSDIISEKPQASFSPDISNPFAPNLEETKAKKESELSIVIHVRTASFGKKYSSLEKSDENTSLSNVIDNEPRVSNRKEGNAKDSKSSENDSERNDIQDRYLKTSYGDDENASPVSPDPIQYSEGDGFNFESFK